MSTSPFHSHSVNQCLSYLTATGEPSHGLFLAGRQPYGTADRRTRGMCDTVVPTRTTLPRSPGHGPPDVLLGRARQQLPRRAPTLASGVAQEKDGGRDEDATGPTVPVHRADADRRRRARACHGSLRAKAPHAQGKAPHRKCPMVVPLGAIALACRISAFCHRQRGLPGRSRRPATRPGAGRTTDQHPVRARGTASGSSRRHVVGSGQRSHTSTRRFCSCPCGVSLDATACASPYPITTTSVTPRDVRYRCTAVARSIDNGTL